MTPATLGYKSYIYNQVISSLKLLDFKVMPPSLSKRKVKECIDLYYKASNTSVCLYIYCTPSPPQYEMLGWNDEKRENFIHERNIFMDNNSVEHVVETLHKLEQQND